MMWKIGGSVLIFQHQYLFYIAVVDSGFGFAAFHKNIAPRAKYDPDQPRRCVMMKNKTSPSPYVNRNRGQSDWMSFDNFKSSARV